MGQQLGLDVGCGGCKVDCAVNCLRPNSENHSSSPVTYEHPDYDVKDSDPFSPADATLPELRGGRFTRPGMADGHSHREDLEPEISDCADAFTETAAAAHTAAHSAAYKQASYTARSGIPSSNQRFDDNIGHLYAPPPPSEYCPAANESYGASCAASSADRSHGVAEGTPIPCFGSSSSADRHHNPAEVGLLAGANAVEEHNAAEQHRGVAVCGALAGDDVSNTGRNSETESETSRSQRVVREFVREITRGISPQLVRNGCDAASFATELVTVSLDKRLRTLCVQHLGPQGQAQHFGLELVIEVAIGTDIRREVDVSVDDLCVTLVLNDLKALSFRFPKSEERDIFALCMSMFIDGRREEVERKSR